MSRSVITYSAPSVPLAGTSRFHRTAAYTRCLRCAGAPRRPAGGSGLSLPFLLSMPLSMTPGSSVIASPELRCRHGLRRDLSSSALPKIPQSVSRGASLTRLHWFASATACQVARPLYGSDWNAQPPGAFTSRLSTDRSPSPLLDITTTATGLLCWRDLHPLEWQLASLHQTPSGHRAQAPTSTSNLIAALVAFLSSCPSLGEEKQGPGPMAGLFLSGRHGPNSRRHRQN